MKNSPKKHTHFAGIGLLEIMLVLAIIGIFLTAAMRYFQVTNRSRQIKDAIQVSEVIYAGGQRWLDDVGNFNQKSKVCGAISINCFAKLGFVPQIYAPEGKNINPWGGTITITPNTDNPKQLNITLAAAPYSLCSNIKNKLKGQAEVNCSDSTDMHISFE